MGKDFVYDKAKDILKWKTEITGKHHSIGVECYSYAGGQEKIQLSKWYKDKAGTVQYVKLGRLTIEEIVKIHEAVQAKMMTTASGNFLPPEEDLP